MGIATRVLLFLPLFLSTTHCSTVSRIQIPIRRHPRLYNGRRSWPHRTLPAPSHVFTLPRACRKTPCQQRAVDEIRRAGCFDALLFDNLFIIKATCPARALPLLQPSRRFVDISRDHRMMLAAPAPRSIRHRDPYPATQSATPQDVIERRTDPAYLAPAETTEPFERLATVRFSTQRLASGPEVEVGDTTDGKHERFWLSGPRRAGRCSGTRGRGVTVYVIDTGCRTTHGELAGRAVAVAAPGSSYRSGSDDHGHGTHVAATIAGSRFGIASQARLVCIKALSERNEGRSTDVIAGVQMAIRMHRAGLQRGLRGNGVVSISLGVRAPRRYWALDRALEEARRHGLVGVVAAGNAGGDACEFTPARARAAITVAATGKDGTLAKFSNRGRCVTVAAPGVHVWSATTGADDQYGRSSGTSMAAPFVSGLVALLLGNEPGLRMEEVARRLRWIGKVGDRAGSESLKRQLPVVSVEGYCQYELGRPARFE